MTDQPTPTLPQETLDRLELLGASKEEVDVVLAKLSRSDAEGMPVGEDTPYWRTLRAALSLHVEDQHRIATHLAANCGYELTGDAYTAPPKPAPDAMRPEILDRVSKAWNITIIEPSESWDTQPPMDERYTQYVLTDTERAELRNALSVFDCDVLGYATRMLTAFVGEHFPSNPDWKPLPNLIGVLTQIDNVMTIARDYKAQLNDPDKPATCNHWPGQKRCGVCGMGMSDHVASSAPVPPADGATTCPHCGWVDPLLVQPGAGERDALVKVRNWLDTQFNEKCDNAKLLQVIGDINDALQYATPPTSTAGEVG